MIYDEEWKERQKLWLQIGETHLNNIDAIGYISLGVWSKENITIDCDNLTIAQLKEIIAAHEKTKHEFDEAIKAESEKK